MRPRAILGKHPPAQGLAGIEVDAEEINLQIVLRRPQFEIGDFGVLSNPVGEPYPRAATALVTRALARDER